jgi:hypothetical protein
MSVAQLNTALKDHFGDRMLVLVDSIGDHVVVEMAESGDGGWKVGPIQFPSARIEDPDFTGGLIAALDQQVAKIPEAKREWYLKQAERERRKLSPVRTYIADLFYRIADRVSP